MTPLAPAHDVPSVYSDLKVVELGGLETLYAGKLLADLGADVALVEPASGHASRRLPPYARDVLDDVSSVPFAYYNGNKRSVQLPLDTASGLETMRDLVAGVDVVLAGGRPSELVALGVAPQSLLERTPSLVVATVTPFGWTGPYAEFAADDLVLEAMGGMMSLGGYHDGRPIRPPEMQSYLGAGLFTATGVAAAIVERDASQLGQHVDISVQESVVMGLENAIQFYDLEGVVRSRQGGRQIQVGRGVYPCADGFVYLMLGLHAGSPSWPKFLAWLDDEEAPGRERLAGEQWGRREYIESDEAKDVFLDVFGSFTKAHTKAELYEAARQRSIPLAPVNDLTEVREDHQLTERGFFASVSADDWSHGPATVPGPPYRMSSTPWRGRHAPPKLGADSDAVVSEVREKERRPHTGGGDVRSDDGPLSGVKVVDLSWVGAGPYCMRFLSDLGADVVKVESSTRVDQIRVSPPFRDGVAGVNRSGYFADRNAGKQSMCVNLKHPEGKELVLRLIEQADVVGNSFAPGTMRRLGLDYEAVHARAPHVIYVEMSMLGSYGPHSLHVGYGLTIGALAGLQHLVGEGDRPPIGTGTNYPDHIPSPGHAAFAIISALRHQRRTGQGQRVELSQTEATVSVIGAAVMADSIGVKQLPQANHQAGTILHDTFRTKDAGVWIAVSVHDESEFKCFADVLGLPGHVDPRWLADAHDTSERAQIREWVERRTATWPASELMFALQTAGVRAGTVQTAKDLVEDDPQLRHRGHWLRMPHPEMGDCVYNAMPLRMSRSRVGPRFGAPLLGEHTTAVLAAYGLSEPEIDRLQRANVLA